jgi:hypothetical protein
MNKSDKKDKTSGGNLGRKTGRYVRSFLDEMRTIAWVKDLMEQTGIKTTNGLGSLALSINGSVEFRFDRYLAGTIPDPVVLDTLDQHPKTAKSRDVFYFGPIDKGEHASLWMLFEDRHDEFWQVIDNAIPQNATYSGNTHTWRIDQLAEQFMSADEWRALNNDGKFQFQSDNPIQASLERRNFEPSWKMLAAVIALWRLSMQNDEGVTPMEYLLHCLLAGPYKKKLEGYGIYRHICSMIKTISVQHHMVHGREQDALQAFSGLDILRN